MKSRALDLVHTWLLLDFFGDSRRRGQDSSSLTSAIFTQSFIALVAAGLLFDADATPVSYAAANLSLSTLLVGIGALSAPERFDRRVADRLIIATAPLPRYLLPLARALHSSFFLVLITTGMAIPPAILMYWVSGHQLWTVIGYLCFANISAGLVAATVAGLIRFWVRVHSPERAALLAGSFKAILLGGGFVGFAVCLPHLQETVAELPIPAAAVLAWPPYWGGRWLAAPIEGWLFLVTAIGTGLLLFVAFVAIGEPERQEHGRIKRRRSLTAALDRHFAPAGPLLGTTRYVATMLGRSPGFRARVLPLFGLPLAMLVLALWESDATGQQLLLGIALQFPAIYLPFLVVFLPFCDGESSASTFETSPHHSLALAREAGLIALATHILLPVQLLALPIVALSELGLLAALSLAAFSWGLSVLVASLALRSLPCIPFTAVADEDAPLEFGGLIGAAIGLALLGGSFALIAPGLAGLGLGLGMSGMAYHRLRRTSGRIA